jgi:hypothetical protein
MVVQQQIRGMKVRSSVKKLCEGCKVCFFLSALSVSSRPLELSWGLWNTRNMELCLRVIE